MNKKQLAANIAATTSLSQVKAMQVVNEIFSADEGIIASVLSGRGKVTIPGFGTFGVKTRAARIGTNPSSGEKIQIDARDFVYFKPGKNLREQVEVVEEG